MAEKIYEIVTEFHRLPRRVPLALYKPAEKTERSKIAVLAMHGGDYMSFPPMIELAKRGFITAGANPGRGDFASRMLDVKAAVDFMKNYPGVEKLILMGHSNGGCLTSGYEYIAENGVERYKKTDRIIPFPDIEPLTPADGIMLLDANYGIMDVLAMDPAMKSLNSGWERIPELDIYNPENGYNPKGSRYDREFVKRFQKAQVKFYEDLLALAQQKAEDIRLGKGMFSDDEPIVIPGAGTGSNANKLFIQDNSLLGHTCNERPLLKKGGEIEHTIVHTVRWMEDAPASHKFNRGSSTTTVQSLLKNELKFDNFGYDETSMWGADWNFNPMSTQANVKGIHIPTLIEGNTASHEYINATYNFDNSVAEDKTEVYLEGADHMFKPEHRMEEYPGQFGDTLATSRSTP